MSTWRQWWRNRRHVLGMNARNRVWISRLNPPRTLQVVDDKLICKQALEDAGVPVSPLYMAYRSHFELSHGRAVAALRRLENGFVCKPARGATGNGVLIIEQPEADGFRRPSGKRVTDQELIVHLRRMLGGEFSARHEQDLALVERRLITDRRITALSGMSTADLRVIVVHAVPLMAMLRLPTVRSQGRANLHAGGIGVGIDIASGRSVAAVMDGAPCPEHPDTGVPLVGVVVPEWAAILDMCRRIGKAMALGYIGVDIMLDTELGPVVIELNGHPGLGIQLANEAGLIPRLQASVERREAG